MASKVSERLPTVLSGCLVLLADGNPHTKTATETTPEELKKVEPNKMLKLSFFVYLSPDTSHCGVALYTCLHLSPLAQ